MSRAKGPVRLLLVDDEQEFLESMGRALQRRGFEVISAVDAEAALDQLERRHFDVAVLDVKMPGLDGVGLFRIVKRRWPDLPVLILTGHATIEQAFQTSRDGVFDYLCKPCEPERLAELVSVASDSRRGAGDEEELPEPEVPIRVLLVDDEEEFLESHSKLLKRRGFEVTTAKSGRRAVERVEEAPFDVVVLDLRMPGMDGLEVLRRIKGTRPNIEVIILTGQPSFSAALKGVRHGAFDFVTKPQEIDQLADRIRAAWRRRQALAEDERREAIRRLVRERPD